MKATVAEIAEWVGGTVVGDGSVVVTGVNPIRTASAGDLTFLSDTRFTPDLNTTQASAVLVGRNVNGVSRPAIQVDRPYEAMIVVLRRVEAGMQYVPEGIHPTASIAEDASVGEGVAVGPLAVLAPGCVIGARTVIHAGACVGAGVRVGADCVIAPNAVLRDHVRLGDRCLIHSGAIIGSDGFGFRPVDGRHVKVPQVGTVVLGDDVEVGANTAIDRGTMDATRIGSGTKIDNLVQIGHNVQVGQNTVICGNAGVAGSTTVGDNVTIAARAGVNGHITIGDGATVAANAGVTNSVKPGQIVFGFPAVEARRGRRMQAALRNLPEALRRIRDLENRLAALETSVDGKAKDDR